MFDLLVYDRAKTQKLLRQGALSLPGKPVESALLPTSELLVLMKEGRSCTLHLLGSSELLPNVIVEERQREFHAPLLIPLTARKLMGGSQGINIINASRSQIKDALGALRKVKEAVSHVAVQVGQR